MKTGAWLVAVWFVGGCSVQVEIDADPRFAQSLDSVTVTVDQRVVRTAAPAVLPIQLSLAAGDCAHLGATAKFNGVAVDDFLSPADFPADLLFDRECQRSVARFTLAAGREDTERACSSSGECATGYCLNSPFVSAGLDICTRTCASDADCPADSGCTTMVNPRICLVRCTSNSDCVAPGPFAGFSFACSSEGLCFWQ